MESLDILNLRAGECSFLEITLTDIRYYIKTFALENKERQVVLVFPPLNAHNRFLIHTLVQNFFKELNTISIGSSYGRRTVVYQSSLNPMLRETELDESIEIHDGDNSMHRSYRTPSERKAQEKLFQSLRSQKKVDKNPRCTERKQGKRPDMPIYVPKALRVSVNNTGSISSSSFKSSNLILPNKSDTTNDFNNISYKTRIKPPSNSNKEQNNCVLTSLDSFNFVDLSNEMNIDEFQTFNNDASIETSESLCSSKLPDYLNINECNSESSKTIDKMKNHLLKHNELESKSVETSFNNCDNTTKALDCSQSVPDDLINLRNQNNLIVNLPDIQISSNNNKISFDDTQESQKTKNLIASKMVDSNKYIKEQIVGTSNIEQHEIYSNSLELELAKEHDTNCPNFCLDDSFTSEPLTDIEEKITSSTDEELITNKSLKFDNNISLKIVKNIELKKAEKKKKKKVLNVDECSWEDLYDKDDDYIHPLLMKELISTMGKVQVLCAKEDYRSHQTIEERSGDGECIIEVYGFSSDLKTIDLMNQFAAFRKNHFEIVWVDDTHALAVFESPNLADRALNTPFAILKTRPLKNAIKESKLRAETIVPLPATRPKTCTAMARRLVSSALGLKMNVSPDLLSAERTMLANAKEKKIRDTELKNNVWNNES